MPDLMSLTDGYWWVVVSPEPDRGLRRGKGLHWYNAAHIDRYRNAAIRAAIYWAHGSENMEYWRSMRRQGWRCVRVRMVPAGGTTNA